ncbi:DUF3846 domain-containing protein [Shimazuella kribbensis]|uniref:DUF3846 domain-containing protein n=1 Tax=Shimazuella kribbensis TaxID=139808 RepID=UPI00041CF923|nr:DUF3846 domain-containing protein [Shimazuella kribbensis]
MKVIIKKPFEDYQVTEIKQEDFSTIVGGIAEYVPIWRNYEMIINEEGKLDELPTNLMERPYSDCIFGNAIFVKYDSLSDEYISLTDKEIEVLKFYLSIKYYSVTREENDQIDPDDYIYFGVISN